MTAIMAMDTDKKQNLLMRTYTPPPSYDFKGDSTGKRCFRYLWLSKYAPWLAYSSHLKGALCKYCVLFPQPVHRGIKGSFIISAYTKYKDFNEDATKHVASMWHKHSHNDASNFLLILHRPEKSVVCQLDSTIKRKIEENRSKLAPILSTILFCATHDIALRGKESDTGNVQGLFRFRVEAGDKILADHLKQAAGNARYTSVRTQNELLSICEDILREDLVSSANDSIGFSILADETADIAGIEQLSLGVRFVDLNSDQPTIREEFLGFISLEHMDAETIAQTLINQCIKFKLDLTKLIGQGYDGCSTMAGKVGGVQAKIKENYPKAAFVYCSAHRLNLVVNDLNSVAEVRNTIGTIKTIIKFFRESPKRRSLIPNIPMLCETRWTAKYQSIRVFSGHFKYICKKLGDLAATASGKTRQDAHQLQCASGTSVFLICMVIMAKYSSMLEPVTQALQAVQLDVFKVYEHVQKLLAIIESHRNEAEVRFKEDIMEKAEEIAQAVGTEIRIPRQCGRQTQRANYQSRTAEEYYRVAIFIPYLDSIITSLKTRFAPENKNHFALFSPHPLLISKLDRQTFQDRMAQANKIYNIDNFAEESVSWFEMWAQAMPTQQNSTSNMPLTDVLKECDLLPAVRKALLITYTLPSSTCQIERAFSTLRRVKTWLRSTMSTERVSALCMMSVHRQKVMDRKEAIIKDVIDRFASDKRRLQFLFSH